LTSFALLALCISPSWDAAVAIRARATLRAPRARRALERLSGVALIALALRVATERA